MLSTTPLDSIDVAEASLASPLAAVSAQEVPIASAAAEAAPVTVPAAPLAMLAPVATVAASPAPAALGTLKPSVPATWPMLGALLLVVGLILVLGKLVKRVQNTRAGQGAALSIKGGVQIGAKERVVWMQAGDKHLLLGVSPGRVQTLHVFDVAPDLSAQAANEAMTPVADEAAVDTPAALDFANRLKTLLAHARAKGLDTEAATAKSSEPMPAAVTRPNDPMLAAVTKPNEPMLAAVTKPNEPMLAAATKPLFSFRA